LIPVNIPKENQSMAIIKTPVDGVSPYQTELPADPIVLRASADGRTVLAVTATNTANTTADIAATAAATAANSTTIVNGQEALNRVITTSRTGVFEGANVNILFEENYYNTTNQVASTTNYAAGGAGEIQYNSGSNSFASSAYLTYTNGNVVTPGIRTDGYFYSNGSPFIGGGNAAIGNFVFTGDTMSINDDANISLNIKGNSLGNNENFITINPTSIDIYAFNTSPYSFSELYLDNSNVSAPYAQIIVKGNSLPQQTWSFNSGGGTIFPTLTTQRGDNPSGTISGQTLLFGDPTQEAIISTPDGTVGNEYSQRLVINPGAGNNFGEGGDIYLWAGRGGANSGSGGDVKIRGGYAPADGTGGYIRMDGGESQGLGAPGFIEITGGQGGAYGGYVQITGGVGGNGTGGAVDLYGGYGIGGPGADVTITGGGSANGLAEYGNVNIAAGASTWSFRNNGTTQFPGNLLQAPAGNPLDIKVTTGNVFSTVSLYDTASQLIIQDNTTGPNPAWALFEADLANVNTPEAVVILKPGDTGNEVRWTFDALGNLNLPLGGNITEGNIPAYTSLTGNTIVLTPSGGTSADQQLVIYPTATPGADANHLHLTSGNLYNTELFLGDDFMYVKLANTGNIVVNTNNLVGNSAQWIFSPVGNLTFPTGMHVDDEGANTRISQNEGWIKMTAGGNASYAAGWSQNEIPGTGNIATISAYGLDSQYPEDIGNLYISVGNEAVNLHNWKFDNQGNLTVPGNINYDGASPAPSINGFDTINSLTVSASGNITGAYLFGNGSGLTGVGAATVPSQNILPAIQTITIDSAGSRSGSGNGYANVIVANVTPVTEYGVIITAGTINQKYVTGALGNIPGPEQILFNTGLGDTPFTVYAYVTSNAGTYYSSSATGTSGMCLLAGTQIALSDGSHKAIEDIVYTDALLSWDFDRGCYAETTALWIKRSETGSQYNQLTFSDGTTLRTFDQHRIFNKQAGAFTYPMTDATPVGTVTVNEYGQEITLINKQVIQDTVDYYNVITDHHMNLFSDSVLTSCRFNNIYPVVDMKFVKDSRTPRTRAEFSNIPDRFFHGLRLTEQTADVETVEWYVDRLVATEVSTQAELIL
jgi:hypothetical protein